MYRIDKLAVLLLSFAPGLGVLSSCTGSSPDRDDSRQRRVLILGVDGMDPVVLRELSDAGRVPNFTRVIDLGSFKPLATSIPPQSPVAWSNFISGAYPGTHEIFDFIHRDPNPRQGPAILPYLSTSKTLPPQRDWAISVGGWRIPLFGGRTQLLRQGGAFWDHLAAHGVDTVIYRMPANYPPPEVDHAGRFRCLCGMGTPDLLGTYGEFTFFTPDAPREGRTVGGGKFVRLRVRNHRATASLSGPDNFLRRPDRRGNSPPMSVEFELVRDPQENVAKITVGDKIVLLNEGEWSRWISVEFKTEITGSMALSAMRLPTSMSAMVRFYLKQVHPKLEVYVTPLNIDPLGPVIPISTPGDFSRVLAQACGRYYTTGIPEDTKALRSGALNEDEFLAQVRMVLDERITQYRYALEQFEHGCLFFYFGHIDQLSHIFWRDRDPQHPGRVPEEAVKYATMIEDAYVEMDALLGEALEVLNDDDTLIIMSDHGFTSFRRGFNLNSWLIDNGYLTVVNPSERARYTYLDGVDWSKTKAYALGLNALYVNLAERETHGVVRPGQEQKQLLAEIAQKLLNVRDTDGSRVIETIYLVDDIYPNADPAIAPDILVGYADGYRASWATAEGGMPFELFEDNLDRWSGDHCVAAHLVPGILVTNRKLRVEDPSLIDLAPTILVEFGVEPPPEMVGRSLFDDAGRP